MRTPIRTPAVPGSRKDKKLQIISSQELIDRIDGWREAQPDKPNLSAAVRRMIEEFLDRDAARVARGGRK